MDLWVVAAAAGAGYIAKYWQNLSGAKDKSSESFSGNSINGQSDSWASLQQVRDRPSLLRRLVQKPIGGDDSLAREGASNENFREMDMLGGDSAAGLASTCSGNCEAAANMGNHEDYNVLSLTSLPPGFSGRESFQENADGISGKNEYFGNSSDVLPEFQTDRFAKKGSLRSRRSREFFVKPSNSLESCLTAQLFRDQAKMEECVLSSLPLPSSPVMRPLLVTDGSRIISRASSDSFGVQFDGREDKLKRETELCLEENTTLLGIPSFQEIRSVQLQRKPNRRCRMQQLSRSGRPLHSQVSGPNTDSRSLI